MVNWILDFGFWILDFAENERSPSLQTDAPRGFPSQQTFQDRFWILDFQDEAYILTSIPESNFSSS
jgi:hypothetical protein